MTTDLVRTKLQASLQTKSLSDLVQERSYQAGTILVLDCSGSMDSAVEWGSRTRRIAALREVVGALGSDRPRMVAFPPPRFVEYPPEPDGQTPLDEAITFCATSRATHLIVVSDGQPDNRQRALAAALAFGGPIDVVYVGPEGESGADFLRQLAASTRGQYHGQTLTAPKQLTQTIRLLLTGRTP